MYCMKCGGPLGYLGQLGKLHHYRCINCGWPAATEEGPLDFDLEDDYCFEEEE